MTNKNRHNISVSPEVYNKLIDISNKEALKQNKRISINYILDRDYL